jgi:hypothetical protein
MWRKKSLREQGRSVNFKAEDSCTIKEDMGTIKRNQ